MVEQLKAPMAAQGTTLKQYLKETLLPAYTRVKAVHGDLDEKGASLVPICAMYRLPPTPSESILHSARGCSRSMRYARRSNG